MFHPCFWCTRKIEILNTSLSRFVPKSMVRGSFPPHYGGGSGNFEIISPPYSETLGGKSGLFPPHISRPWGGNFIISPPRWGGRARRRRKILRILTPEMLEILKKNAFPNVKMTGNLKKFPPAAGYFPCSDSIFCIKRAPKSQKISACGGHIVIEIRLVIPVPVLLKFFLRACSGPS